MQFRQGCCPIHPRSPSTGRCDQRTARRTPPSVRNRRRRDSLRREQTRGAYGYVCQELCLSQELGGAQGRAAAPNDLGGFGSGIILFLRHGKKALKNLKRHLKILRQTDFLAKLKKLLEDAPRGGGGPAQGLENFEKSCWLTPHGSSQAETLGSTGAKKN